MLRSVANAARAIVVARAAEFYRERRQRCASSSGSADSAASTLDLAAPDRCCELAFAALVIDVRHTDRPIRCPAVLMQRRGAPRRCRFLPASSGRHLSYHCVVVDHHPLGNVTSGKRSAVGDHLCRLEAAVLPQQGNVALLRKHCCIEVPRRHGREAEMDRADVCFRLRSLQFQEGAHGMQSAKRVSVDRLRECV